MEQVVEQIYSSGTDHKVQLDSLINLLNKVYPVSTPNEINVDELLALVSAVVTKETGSMVVSRQFISHIDQYLERHPPYSTLLRSIATGILNVTQSRAISYEEQAISLRLKVASAWEKEGSWLEAANMLQSINMENSQRTFDPAYKMQQYLKTGRLYLDADNVEQAESSANRASMLLSEVKNNSLSIQLKALTARVLDRRRKFADAAQRYYELTTSDIPLYDKLMAMTSAITCTILAAPGTHRTRLLATISKDEGAKGAPQFNLLEKLFLERLIRGDELAEFEKTLTDWQAKDDKGESIIRKVMVEHNLAAAGQIYENITFETLSDVLGVSEKVAEHIAAKMISTGRLEGRIDQIENLLYFNGRSPIEAWDDRIEAFCQQLDKTAQLIISKHPELESLNVTTNAVTLSS